MNNGQSTNMRRRILLAGLLILLSSLAFAQNVENQLMDAVALYNNRNFAQSRTLLQTLSKAAPDNDAVWYYLGLDEAMLGNADAAASHFRKAVELDPHNYWYKRRLADLYQAAGEDEMVIQMDESILAEFPDKTEVLYDLLGLYLKQQSYEKALRALDDIEKTAGPSEQATRTRYDILRQLNRDEEAIQTLVDFNDQYTSPSILSMMGDYYLSEHKDSLSLACYDEALRTQSDYVPAILGRSEVFRLARRYPEYFAALDAFIDNDNVPVEAKGMYVGNVVRSLDPKLISLHRDGFDEVVDRLVDRHPSDTAALATAGGYFYATGQLDKGVDCFKKVHPDPDDGRALGRGAGPLHRRLRPVPGAGLHGVPELGELLSERLRRRHPELPVSDRPGAQEHGACQELLVPDRRHAPSAGRHEIGLQGL